jgi:hypothetical protein
MGFFGPIGVSAIFYLYIALDFLQTITIDGIQRDDARKLGEVVMVVVWFLAICSNVRILLTLRTSLYANHIYRSFMD